MEKGNSLKKELIGDDDYYSPKFHEFVTFEVEKQYYPLIGEFISIFNTLEDTLNEDLVELLDSERLVNVGWIVISEMSFSSKVNLWERLVLNVCHFAQKDASTPPAIAAFEKI